MSEFLDFIISSPYLLYFVLGIVMLPGILLAAYAQHKVMATFKKYKNVQPRTRLPAVKMARMMLDANSLSEVQIINVSGTLTDYYHPKNKQLALSDSVMNSSSISALGVAGHEVGHAIQHKRCYLPAKLRGALVPVVNIMSTLSWPIVVIALTLGAVSPDFAPAGIPVGKILLIGGIIFFGGSALFSLITLPTEFDASKRAYKMLIKSQILTKEEAKGVKKVLNAAALTYIASLLTSILALARFILFIFLSSRKNKK